MGGYGWEEHPERYPCPRCGSVQGDDFCLPLSDAHPHATVLAMHKERGMSPADLTRGGYVTYSATVAGQQVTLWRKPGTRKCTRGSRPPNAERGGVDDG